MKMPRPRNYTDGMVATLRKAAPLNWAKAKELSVSLNRSPKSIVAKAKNAGIPYESMPRRKTQGDVVTKADLVSEIKRALATDDSLEGLELAKAQALINLLKAIP
tara:strand:- start:63 stop:377 length:315 start_codon:yes stop_codon:yes gene_type:complete